MALMALTIWFILSVAISACSNSGARQDWQSRRQAALLWWRPLAMPGHWCSPANCGNWCFFWIFFLFEQWKQRLVLGQILKTCMSWLWVWQHLDTGQNPDQSFEGAGAQSCKTIQHELKNHTVHGGCFLVGWDPWDPDCDCDHFGWAGFEPVNDSVIWQTLSKAVDLWVTMSRCSIPDRQCVVFSNSVATNNHRFLCSCCHGVDSSRS